jgi:hypothetical protein
MRKRKAKLNYRRIVLRLPDLDHSKMAVLNSLTSPGSRRVYQFAINQFITWYCSEPRLAFNRIVVVRYRMYLESRRLAANTINQQLAAVRRLAHEAADAGLLSPDLAAGISRVKGVKQLGQRSGNWLSLEQSCRASSVETPETPWVKPYRKVRSAWASGPAEKHYRIHPSEWFADSCFSAVGETSVTERRQVTIADLIGRALSRSNTSPEAVAGGQEQFEAEIAAALEPFVQDGVLVEQIVARASIFGRLP